MLLRAVKKRKKKFKQPSFEEARHKRHSKRWRGIVLAVLITLGSIGAYKAINTYEYKKKERAAIVEVERYTENVTYKPGRFYYIPFSTPDAEKQPIRPVDPRIKRIASRFQNVHTVEGMSRFLKWFSSYFKGIAALRSLGLIKHHEVSIDYMLTNRVRDCILSTLFINQFLAAKDVPFVDILYAFYRRGGLFEAGSLHINVAALLEDGNSKGWYIVDPQAGNTPLPLRLFVENNMRLTDKNELCFRIADGSTNKNNANLYPWEFYKNNIRLPPLGLILPLPQNQTFCVREEE